MTSTRCGWSARPNTPGIGSVNFRLGRVMFHSG